MARVVVMGAGIGGISQVYELRKELGKEHQIILIGDSERFEFTPSNPWVAVGWRKQNQITVDLPELMKKHGIEYYSQGAKRLHPEENRLELNDETVIEYDYLVIATGPRLAFEEVKGLGPDGHTQSICKTGHAEASFVDFEKLAANPGPVIVGAATGAPKTGYMIESMVTATTHNVAAAIKGEEPRERGSWSAVCLADFGDTGVAFVALPQIPPRNTNWASRGKWVHVAKVAYEKYFLHKVRAAKTEPYYEKMILKMLGAERLRNAS